MTNLTPSGRYRAQHRAPSTTTVPGRLPIAGSLAVLVVAGGTLAVSCTADQQENASWQRNATSSSAAASTSPSTSAAASPTASPAAQRVSALTNDELANVKRVSWSLDGRLLAVHDKGTPLHSLGDLAKIAAGDHKLTAVVELEDGRILTLTAPFNSSGSSKDLTIDARAARSAHRAALQKQQAQKAQQQRAQQEKQAQAAAAAAAAAAKQHAAQAKQAAQARQAAKAAATNKPAAVRPATKQAAATPAAPEQAAQKPAAQQKAAAPKPPAAPKQAAAPAAPPPQPASGSFDPVKFDWSSVGGPSKSTGGGITLATPGAGISNCNIGTLSVHSDGQTISNCTINGGVFGSGGFTLDHSFVTSNADGMDPTGNGRKVIQYNKIWRDGSRVGSKHQDGIQFWQGGNALISHNWIGGFQTSAIMVKADKGTISNVTIDSNFLHNPTGYFQLYLCKAGHDLKNITVTNNAFGKAQHTISTCHDNLTFVHTEAQRQAAIKAGNAGAASWIVWDNNYVAGTHAVVAPPGGWDQ